MKNKKFVKSISLMTSLASFTIFSSVLASNIISSNAKENIIINSKNYIINNVKNDPINASTASADLFFTDPDTTGNIIYEVNQKNSTITITGSENLVAINPSLKSKVTLTIDGKDQIFNLVNISANAFANISAEQTIEGYLTIPDTVISIGKEAFRGCNIRYISLPSSLKTIDDYAFGDCPINSIQIIDNPYFSLFHLGDKGYILINGVSTSWDYDTPPVGAIAYGDIDLSKMSGKAIDYGMFMYCDGLTSVKLPSNITIIEDMAFADCSFIHKINLENITSINFGAFRNCSGLTSLILSKIEYIGECAFLDFFDLQSIEFSNNLSFIATNAFENCSGLTSITFQWTKHQIQTLDFSKIEPWFNNSHTDPSTIKIYVPAGQQQAYWDYRDKLDLGDLVNINQIIESKYMNASSWINEASGYLEYLTNDVDSTIQIYGTRNLISINPIISSIVTFNDSSYTINCLMHNLFENNLDLDGDLIIDSSITDIQAYVFNGCSNIDEINLMWNMDQLNDWFDLNNSTFNIDPYWLGDLNSESLKIVVPQGCLNVYKQYASQLGIDKCKIVESNQKKNINLSLVLDLVVGIGIPMLILAIIGTNIGIKKYKEKKMISKIIK